MQALEVSTRLTAVRPTDSLVQEALDITEGRRISTSSS